MAKQGIYSSSALIGTQKKIKQDYMRERNDAPGRMETLMRSIEMAGGMDETLDELKAAAFEVLLLNPGSEQSDCAKMLVEQYGTELIDAYGTDPAEIYHALADLWESPYYDRNTDLEYTYETWALALHTEQSVDMYYDLIKKITDLKIR